MALIGKGISAGGRAVKKRHDQRREHKAADMPGAGERADSASESDSDAVHFDVVATVPAEVLTAVRGKGSEGLKAKLELKKERGLSASELAKAKKLLIKRWNVEPDEPSVVAARVQEDSATDVRDLIEKLGGRAELVPATQRNSHDGQTETVTEPPADEASQSPAGPGPSPQASEGVLAQVEKLGQLHDAGVLTDEEFQAKKAELLERL
jgi:hypothetical protein